MTGNSQRMRCRLELSLVWKLLPFYLPYLIRSNFIKTTYDISLDSQISFLPLGFSPTEVVSCLSSVGNLNPKVRRQRNLVDERQLRSSFETRGVFRVWFASQCATFQTLNSKPRVSSQNSFSSFIIFSFHWSTFFSSKRKEDQWRERWWRWRRSRGTLIKLSITSRWWGQAKMRTQICRALTRFCLDSTTICSLSTTSQ